MGHKFPAVKAGLVTLYKFKHRLQPKVMYLIHDENL